MSNGVVRRVCPLQFNRSSPGWLQSTHQAVLYNVTLVDEKGMRSISNIVLQTISDAGAA